MNSQCPHCLTGGQQDKGNPRLQPISSGGAARRVRWWCAACGFVEQVTPEVPFGNQFTHLLRQRGLDGERFLGQELDGEAFDYFV